MTLIGLEKAIPFESILPAYNRIVAPSLTQFAPCSIEDSWNLQDEVPGASTSRSGNLSGVEAIGLLLVCRDSSPSKWLSLVNTMILGIVIHLLPMIILQHMKPCLNR